jgi:3-methyladenine DNA glycosylase/8-oxoguanine DNA glycosylase
MCQAADEPRKHGLPRVLSTGVHERREIEVPSFDLIETLRFQRVGPYDPCGIFDARARRFVFAFRNAGGPVTLSLTQRAPTTVEAEAWGDGAALALDHVPAICGAHDDPDAFSPSHEGLRVLGRRFRKMRMPRVPWSMESLVAIVLQQRVAFVEAAKSWRSFALERGEPAPGPHGLALMPSDRALEEIPTWSYREMLVDRKRELAIRALLDHRREIDAIPTQTFDEVRASLLAIPGMGPWSVESFLGQSRGDADAVPILDYWMPHMISFALTGEGRSNDAEMLALLAPFKPHRYRVIRLIGAAGFGAQRRGPRKKTMMMRPK